MNLKEKVKQLPTSPGVYLMKDSAGQIIYVGKSKNLKNRVLSYFQSPKSHTKKVEKMVNHLKDFDYLVTDTEFEAFMLECRLIKKIQPLYNRLMKSPQSYIYVVIERKKETSEISLANIYSENEDGLYFGPFSNRGSTEKAIQGLIEFFQIDCSNNSNSHTPCLNYTLGKCIGHCFDQVAKKQHEVVINRITDLLDGKDLSIIKEIEQEMQDASIHFNFEKAAQLRDTLAAVRSLIKKEKVIEFAEENKNIVVVEQINNEKMKLFLINRNKILFQQLYDLTIINEANFFKEVKESILNYFRANEIVQPVKVRKEEIDEAHIIYRYLTNRSSDYIIIPSKWLNSSNEKVLDKTLYEFLHLKVCQIID